MLVLKNYVKQLTLLTFCKDLKNLRKLDEFSGLKDFDGKNTHVRNNFTNFKCCIPMGMGHISSVGLSIELSFLRRRPRARVRCPSHPPEVQYPIQGH